MLLEGNFVTGLLQFRMICLLCLVIEVGGQRLVIKLLLCCKNVDEELAHCKESRVGTDVGRF